MITPRLYESLDEEEKKLWHSHDYEVRTLASLRPFHIVLSLSYTCSEETW